MKFAIFLKSSLLFKQFILSCIFINKMLRFNDLKDSYKCENCSVCYLCWRHYLLYIHIHVHICYYIICITVPLTKRTRLLRKYYLVLNPRSNHFFLFYLTWETNQKQPPGVFCKKGVLKNFENFAGKHMF